MDKYIGIFILESEHYRFKGQIHFAFLDFESTALPTLASFEEGHIYGIEKLREELEEREYRADCTSLSYCKKDKEDFFECCSQIWISIGVLKAFDLHRIIGSYYGGGEINYKNHDSIIEKMERIKERTIEKYPIFDMSLKELLIALDNT